MQKLTFKTRLSWWFSFILAFSLILLTVVFTVFYAGFTLVNRQTFMLREAKEVYEKHITVENSRIFFKRDDQNKTLSAYLRDEGLSAVILDADRKVIGTYGVYVSLLEEQSLESLIKKPYLDETFLEGKTPFRFYQLKNNRTDLVMSYPIFSDQEIVGAILLSSDVNLFPGSVVFLISVLLLLLITSIISGWVFTYLIVNKQFEPLHRILDEMNDYEIGKTLAAYEVNGNNNDEIVRLSKAFKSMIARINEGSQKQAEFIANASHELKTPLANSLLTLNLASMDLGEKKYKKAENAIEVVKRDLKEFGDLINSLLEIAKIEKAADADKEISVRRIVKDVVTSQKGNKLKEIKIDIEKDYKICFPENHLRIILNNLIGNAVKYTKIGGEIRIKVVNTNGVVIVVENETDRITVGDLQKIWQRHERLEVFEQITGNGIGLYLVREIADHHRLGIKQELKKGVFRIAVRGFENYT